MTVRGTKTRQSATCVINRFYSYLLVLFIATQVSGAAFGQCSKPVFKVQPVNKSGCKDTEIVLQATVSGATRYQWCWSGSGFPNKAVPGGHVWSGSTTNRLTIKGSNDVGGTYWLRATNSCGTTLSNSVTVTISKPPVMASNSSPVCEGEPLKLIGTSLAGGVFEWTGPNGFKSTLKSPVVSDNATPAMAGVYSFKVTLGTCIVISTTTVTINLAPNFRPTSNSPVCKGGKLTLGGAPAGMSRYSWIGPNGFSSTSPAPTVSNNATPLMSGIYRLTVYNKNGCSKQMATRVSVDTNPVITAQPENVTVCEGAKANFSIEAPGATNNYQWYWSKSTLPNQEVPDPAVWAGSKSSKLTINTKAGELSGDYWVKVTNSCGTVVSGKAQLKLLHIDVGATYSGPVCEGDPLQVMASGATGTYLWTGPGGFISTERSPVVSFSATPAMAGVYTLTTTNQQGCSKKAMATVEVKTNCVEQDMNYVASHQILKDEVLDEGDLDLLPAEAASLTYTYYDGLGRPVQQVNKQATPAMSDMVQPFAYDKFGRESVQYLPYADRKGTGRYRGNAFNENHNSSDQYRFYTNFYDNAGDVPYSTVAYGKSRYEDSPLNRVLEQGAPGEAWQIGGATVKYDYGSNTATDKVLIWADNNSGLPEVSGFYEGGELFKNMTTDEENHKTITFADKLGKTVLKRVQAHENGAQEQWADTYFIYNDFGKLTFVLPPGANDEIAKGATIDDTFLSRWAYCYKYDGRKRMTEKRVPGSDWVYMIYDNRNRLVLTQDGNQRVRNEWIFTKYDKFNRPIATGTYVHPEEATRLQMQNHVNGRIGEEEWHEIYVGADGLHGYSDQSFPKGLTESDYLTVTYYDNYSFKNLEGFGPVYDYDATQLDPEIRALDTYTFPATAFTHVKGEVTGSKVKVMDGTDTWINSATYYDDRYRAIQTITDNYNGSIDKYSTLYNFPGWVLATYTHHQKNDTTSYGIKKRYTYDHAGRLMQGFHELIENGESQGEVLLAENKYNELGKLIEKNLHVENSAPHQSVDFRYNIRGWLKRINGAGLHNDGSEPQDFFGIEFYYEETERNVKNTPVYNGNLSATKWSNNLGLGDLEERGYTYTYDPMNRLKSAQHHRRLSKSWGSVSDYGLSGISYDKNGNILSLTRNDEQGNLLDDLSYTYDGNQLLTVVESQSGNSLAGFRQGKNSGKHYSFDANGNLTRDENNHIEYIYYNHLNLAEYILYDDGRAQGNIYDANGRKVAEEMYSGNGSLLERRDFAGDFTYRFNRLEAIQHEEGQIVLNPYFGGYEYQYNLTDHLGNTRLTFTTRDEVFEYLATMETENAEEEEQLFSNVPETRIPFVGASNSPDKVARVNQNQPIGPAIGIKVNPGDVIALETYAYYEGGSGYSAANGLSTIIAAVASSYGGVNGGTEYEQAIYNTFENAFGFFNKSTSTSDNIPAAYLNYIVLDAEMNHRQSGFVQVSDAANFQLEKLAINNINIEEEGYLYVYVSNESATDHWVYFDDLKLTHHRSKVIKSEDYYPMGLSFNPYHRDYSSYAGSVNTRGVAHGMKDLGFRRYDAVLGRFHNIDPLAELQLDESPFQYAGNNPVNNTDALGLIKWPGFLTRLVGKVGAAVMSLTSGQKYTARMVNNKVIYVLQGKNYKPRRSGSRTESTSTAANKDTTGDQGKTPESKSSSTASTGESTEKSESSENATSFASSKDHANPWKESQKESVFGPDRPALSHNVMDVDVQVRQPRFKSSTPNPESDFADRKETGDIEKALDQLKKQGNTASGQGMKALENYKAGKTGFDYKREVSANLMMFGPDPVGAGNYLMKLWKDLGFNYPKMYVHPDKVVVEGEYIITDDAGNEISTTYTVTFDNSDTERELFDKLTIWAGSADYWGKSAAVTDQWRDKINYHIKDLGNATPGDEGGLVLYSYIIADVVTAPYVAAPTIYSGKHWRTDEQLAGWERALAVLDLVPGEALAKAGIVAIVVKIGGKVVDVAKLSAISRRAIAKAIQFGSKVLPTANEQFTLIGKSGATIGVLLKEGADDVLRVANDGWLDDAVDIASDQVSQVSSSVVVKDGLGNVVTEAVYMVKKADGTVGFVKAGDVVLDGTKHEWTNLAGKTLDWTKQSAGDIENSIVTALESSNEGWKVEGKVGDFVRQHKSVEAFGQKIKRANNSVAAELDVVTADEVIEVKKNIDLAKDKFVMVAKNGNPGQAGKLVNAVADDFVNHGNKTVILYIDEVFNPTYASNKAYIEALMEEGIIVVNSLEELEKIIN